MDSVFRRDGWLVEVVDADWQVDRLPHEDVAVPQLELPELEPDNGNTQETLQEQDQKWTDLSLNSMTQQASGPQT